eukprot:m51a1_g1263 putative DNA-directed RNA polymerase (1659) ;mRNA; f:56514-62305
MPVDPPIRCEVAGATFSFYTPEEIREISVRKITNAQLFDNLDAPVSGGLYDLAMGPVEKFGTCRTCGLVYKFCPGHFGHIDLAEPVYNPFMFAALIQLLRGSCLHCFRLRLPAEQMKLIALQLKALDSGDLCEALKWADRLQQLRAPSKGDDENSGRGDGEDYEDEDVELCHSIESARKAVQAGASSEDLRIHIQMFRRQLFKQTFTDMAKSSANCPHPDCCMPRTKVTLDATKTKLFFQDLLKRRSSKAAKSKKTAKKSAKKAKDDEAEEGSDEEEEEEEEEAEADSEKRYVTPAKAREIVTSIWDQEDQKDFIAALFGENKPSRIKEITAPGPYMYFLEALCVPPNRFRPAVAVGQAKAEHPQTSYFRKILEHNQLLIEAAREDASGHRAEAAEDEESGKPSKKRSSAPKRPSKKMTRVELLVQIQQLVNGMCIGTDPLQPPSVKTVLEKKEGLFRKHMMGKRVNFAARSVISPDPYISTNQIGLPLYFGMKLCYPEAVNPLNYEHLKQCVINGADTYPGANFIEDEEGFLIDLRLRDSESREALANSLLRVSEKASRKYKIVYRHVRDGDMALVNRQPTLHKPGIMAHEIRVLNAEKTIRMHYTNCSTYNADFDGDEMNIHVPQGEMPRAEASMIAFTDEQYIVPKSGDPLRGLIQDSVITGVLLTKKDTFFTKKQFQQLLFACLFDVNNRHPIVTPQPAIWRPQMLWTGKQLIGAVLDQITVGKPPLSMESGTKVAGGLWGRGGYHFTKPLKKGEKPKDMQEIWSGANESIVVVNRNQLLAGVLDKSAFGATAFGLVHSCYELYGSRTAGQLLTTMCRLFVSYMQCFRGFTCGMDDLVLKPDAERNRRLILTAANEQAREKAIDFLTHGNTDPDAIQRALVTARASADVTAQLDRTVKTAVNTFTSKVIDQCLPDGTIKPFPWNNMGLMTGSGARGSNVNFSQISCLLGQQELEGKRVPMMVSGKTLPSFRAHDTSARAGGFVMDRFLTGVRPQEFYFHCMAGREGLIDTAVKTSRSGYLQRCVIKLLESLKVHYDYTVRDGDGSVVQFAYGDDAIDVTRTGFLTRFKFWASNFEGLMTKYNMREAATKFDIKAAAQATREMNSALADPKSNDPVMSHYFPSERLGVTSEKFHSALMDYVKTDPDGYFSKAKVPAKKFQGLMSLKYQRSLVDPGEPVGVLAAQSIGEPSTQMTLNTFHLAGRGEMNVTLGMPRLRELLMFAKKDIATPTMIVATKENTEEAATRLAKQLSRLTMADLVEDLAVSESLSKDAAGRRVRRYTIEVRFKPDLQAILADYSITDSTDFTSRLKSFRDSLRQAVGKQLKVRKENVSVAACWSRRARNDEDGAVGSDDEREEEPEDRSKKSRRRKDDEESDDEEVADDIDGQDAEDLRQKKSNEATYAADEEDRAIEKSPDEEETLFEDVEKPKEKRTEDAEGAEDVAEVGASVTQSKWWETRRMSINLELPANQKVQMLQIAERCVEQTIVSQQAGLRRCFVTTRSSKAGQEHIVQTEGVNFTAIAKFQSLADFKTLSSNDVYNILQFFGVEAARAAIVHEVGSVFKVYGINVNYRHLALIADWMTFEGGFRPLNRMGIDSSTSPLLKMTYESTTTFLARAAIQQETDMLHSPSANIVLGKPVTHGTGAFELRQIINPN